MEQRPWEANSHSFSQETLSFTEPKGALPCSQGPTTGPYPKPDASNPHLRTLFL